jgi:hypothetical protein
LEYVIPGSEAAHGVLPLWLVADHQRQEWEAERGRIAALPEIDGGVGGAGSDPLWPLPLWANYDDELGSRIADLNNVSGGTFAGSIIGALFLKRFVTATPRWIHADIYVWNAKDRPGRPVGAEAQGVRAMYALIRQRFG